MSYIDHNETIVNNHPLLRLVNPTSHVIKNEPDAHIDQHKKDERSKCTSCYKNLPLDQFSVDKMKKNGIHTQCKNCKNLKQKKTRARMRDDEMEEHSQSDQSDHYEKNDQTEKSTCAACHKQLSLDHFTKDRSKPNGVYNYCKICKNHKRKIFDDRLKNDNTDEREYKRIRTAITNLTKTLNDINRRLAEFESKSTVIINNEQYDENSSDLAQSPVITATIIDNDETSVDIINHRDVIPDYDNINSDISSESKYESMYESTDESSNTSDST